MWEFWSKEIENKAAFLKSFDEMRYEKVLKFTLHNIIIVLWILCDIDYYMNYLKSSKANFLFSRHWCELVSTIFDTAKRVAEIHLGGALHEVIKDSIEHNGRNAAREINVGQAHEANFFLKNSTQTRHSAFV